MLSLNIVAAPLKSVLCALPLFWLAIAPTPLIAEGGDTKQWYIGTAAPDDSHGDSVYDSKDTDARAQLTMKQRHHCYLSLPHEEDGTIDPMRPVGLVVGNQSCSKLDSDALLSEQDSVEVAYFDLNQDDKPDCVAIEYDGDDGSNHGASDKTKTRRAAIDSVEFITDLSLVLCQPSYSRSTGDSISKHFMIAYQFNNEDELPRFVTSLVNQDGGEDIELDHRIDLSKYEPSAHTEAWIDNCSYDDYSGSTDVCTLDTFMQMQQDEEDGDDFKTILHATDVCTLDTFIQRMQQDEEDGGDFKTILYEVGKGLVEERRAEFNIPSTRAAQSRTIVLRKLADPQGQPFFSIDTEIKGIDVDQQPLTSFIGDGDALYGSLAILFELISADPIHAEALAENNWYPRAFGPGGDMIGSIRPGEHNTEPHKLRPDQLLVSYSQRDAVLSRLEVLDSPEIRTGRARLARTRPVHRLPVWMH